MVVGGARGEWGGEEKEKKDTEGRRSRATGAAEPAGSRWRRGGRRAGRVFSKSLGIK